MYDRTCGSMTKRDRADRREFRIQHKSDIVFDIVQYKSDIVARFSRHGQKNVAWYEVCLVRGGVGDMLLECIVEVLGLGWVGQFLM